MTAQLAGQTIVLFSLDTLRHKNHIFGLFLSLVQFMPRVMVVYTIEPYYFHIYPMVLYQRGVYHPKLCGGFKPKINRCLYLFTILFVYSYLIKTRFTNELNKCVWCPERR